MYRYKYNHIFINKVRISTKYILSLVYYFEKMNAVLVPFPVEGM